MYKRQSLGFVCLLHPGKFLFNFFFVHYEAAFLICTYKLLTLFHHISPALFTANIGRLLPAHKITFRIIDAAVVFSTFFCLFKNNIFAALWTTYTNLFVIWLCVSTVREAWTSKELSVWSIFCLLYTSRCV